jgi:hypothetical protein
MVDAVDLLGQVVGILIAGGLTLAVVVLLQGPVERFLLHLLNDPVVARMGTLFIVVLFSLHGLATVLDYITQPELHAILGGLSALLLRMADAVQWLIQVAALLFIGYSLRRGWGNRDVAERDLAVRGAGEEELEVKGQV